MPTISEIKNSGTDISLVPRPIDEPLNAPSLLSERLDRFGDNYNTSHNSSLYKLLVGLAGETGAGSLSKGMLYPKLQSALESTHYDDLDKLYGNPIGLSRLPEEIYTVDPRNSSLIQSQWDDVYAKDSSYRHRCLTWMRAIIAGGSPEGLSLAGEAATGIECDIIEQYKYLDNQRSDVVISMANRGLTSSRNEFILVPRTIYLSPAQHRQIITLVDRLRPVNTVPTVYVANRARTARAARAIFATSSAYNISRMVTGRTDINWPTPDPSQGLWITQTEQEAPTFAFMERQEALTFMTIASVTASSDHIGAFNKTQTSLFPYLAVNVDPLFQYDAAKSYAPSYAPLQLSITWMSRS